MSHDIESTPNGATVEYEFTPLQNRAIGTLITAMRTAGIAWIVFGLVSAVTLLLVRGQSATFSGQLAAAVIGLVANSVMGIATLSATSSLRRVVDTKGHDVTHTMAALTLLLRVFGALQIIIIVALALGVAMFFYLAPSVGALPFLHG